LKVSIKTISQRDCTIGVLNYSNFRCFTMELPDLDNQTNISCIPAGRYNCEKYYSQTHGWCIAILDVPNRTEIRVHPANYTRQLRGCIAVGESLKDIDKDGVFDVTSSGKTMGKLMAILPDKFEMEITRI